MNRGLEQGYANGVLSGDQSGLGQGLQSNVSMKWRLNALNPTSIIEPKLKPVFYINGDNVATVSGSVQQAYNVITSPTTYVPSTSVLVPYFLPFQQTAGTTYRPPLVLRGLNGKNYMNFADTSNRYLASSTSMNNNMYANTTAGSLASGNGMTYMFVIKRANGGGTILDARDSSTLATTNDLLLEVDSSGRITFEYCGGNAGSVTNIKGNAGVNLLNDWSILTVKCQLRIDGGGIPTDSQLPNPLGTKRYANPSGASIGPSSPIDIFVNGVEQQKKITVNTFTNADYYNDLSYRMLDRDTWIGNKGSVFATSGTHIAAALLIPTYIDKAYQQRLENYFRVYYSLPF
jgi:hypothetical protein